MQVTTDDSLRRVDARWLGVPGFTFPWNPTRYTAYAVGAPVFLLTIWLVTRFAPWGAWTVIYTLVFSVFLTTRLMRMVDDERPAAAIPPLVWGELGAPRTSPHAKTQAGSWDLRSIPIFTRDGSVLVNRPPARGRRRLRGRS